jgi:DNA-directed RNA polymerase subunit RPC12/RpoP
MWSRWLNVLSIYSAYECRTCKKEFVLLSEDVEQMEQGRYVVCPYCSSQRVGKQRVADSLKECMSERSYKRVHGVIRQK